MRTVPVLKARAACAVYAAEEPTRRVAEYLATYDLLSAPVCDAQGRLLGAVSIDDVLDHLLPEAWRRSAGAAR